ncbi:MAG TPA: hypothetical protein VKM94_01975 [Blastocatellia bacterium]|nr:hypothetical protein [Blastocatellia bacterium]
MENRFWNKAGPEGARDEAAKKEPPSVINGVLYKHVISGKIDRAGGQTDFSLSLGGAAVSQGKLSFRVSLSAGGRSADLNAVVTGIMGRVFDPRSGSTDQQYKKGDKDSEKNNTQLAPPQDTQLACAVMFLKLPPSSSLRNVLATSSAVQVGASLALYDNEIGEEISRNICRIIADPASPTAKEALLQLNRRLTH